MKFHWSPPAENLMSLIGRIRILESEARGPFTPEELFTAYQHNLTALPRIDFQPKSFRTLKWNTTLLQLHSGLKSFEHHFDWLRQVRQNKSMNDSPVTQEIVHQLHKINQLLQKQIKNPPPTRAPPELPRLTNNWDIHTSSIVVHQHLKNFCDWSLRVLFTFMRKR